MGWPSFPLIFSSNHVEYWGETDASMHSSQFNVWALFILVVRQNIGKIHHNLEIHTEVYILIDMCSAEARVIISTGSTKFHPVAIF